MTHEKYNFSVVGLLVCYAWFNLLTGGRYGFRSALSNCLLKNELSPWIEFAMLFIPVSLCQYGIALYLYKRDVNQYILSIAVLLPVLALHLLAELLW